MLKPSKSNKLIGNEQRSSDCDCSGGDCACSLSNITYDPIYLASDQETLDVNQYKISSAYSDIQISNEYIICYSPYSETIVINNFGKDLLNKIKNLSISQNEINNIETKSAIRNFISCGLIVNKTQSLPVLEEKLLSLTAWLHITDRCNLRCTYCYLPHVREDMSLETGKAAIDAIFRSAQANDFKQVKLKYAGGEPLLKFDLVVKLHTYAQTTCKDYGVEKIEGIVLSNGTLLTLEMIEKMKVLKLRLMISLDGMGQYHDSHRPYAGGRGSFKDVCDGIELAIANDLKPNISVTISSKTADGLSDVMAFILKHDLQFSLNFYRENELSANHEDMKIDEEKIINGMLSAFREIEKDIPRNSFLGGLVDRANLSAAHTHTCGVGQNYLVFDQNGQVAKCQMHIRKPITNIHVADPLAVIRADQTGIQNLPVLEKEGCKTCEWKDFCTGGCPLATFRATGRYDVKSPNCNIYKALFPEAMRLEGLRLLKYQDDPEVVMKI
jgi:uncharacterized protein